MTLIYQLYALQFETLSVADSIDFYSSSRSSSSLAYFNNCELKFEFSSLIFSSSSSANYPDFRIRGQADHKNTKSSFLLNRSLFVYMRGSLGRRGINK